MLGPNEHCWRSEFFPKYPGDEGTDWHQADTFANASGVPQILWPEGAEEFGGTITVWTAFTEATEENGCLQFLPGSHRARRLEEPDGRHEQLFDSPVEPSLDVARLWPDLTPVLAPRPAGSAVMFSGFMAHRSARNTTASDRRAVSYVYPLVKW